MEKAFIVTKESEYYNITNKFLTIQKQQSQFVNKFFSEKGIKSIEYMVDGDGFVNKCFQECDKDDIKLYIIPTENDLINFSKILCKPDGYGLCAFKKNCKITKEFAQKCIDEKIVINLWRPRVADYFESLSNGLHGCSYSQFEYNDKLYLKVSSKYLKEDDIPKGFNEIKLSEYYKVQEEHEDNKK